MFDVFKDGQDEGERIDLQEHGDTMDTAIQLNDALLPFVPREQVQRAMLAVLDIHASHRARLATILTAAAMRLGQSEWLNELTTMEDART